MFLIGITRLPISEVLSAPAEPEPAEREKLYRNHTAEEFQKLPEANKKIDTDTFNEELLSAAIYHETNVRRAKHDLPKLDYHPRVDDAAEKHAKQMAEGNYLSHGTPKQPKSTTPYERLKQQGLNPRFSAENVAYNFVLQYDSGRPFYQREEDGKTVYSYKPGGTPIPHHTYVGFARTILDQWMNSPGHRKNILATEPSALGVGCALSTDEKKMKVIYCDQDFFSPLPEGAVPIAQ